MNEELQKAIAELEKALQFYDQVSRATEDERIAVGRDHHDWIMDCCRKIVTLK